MTENVAEIARGLTEAQRRLARHALGLPNVRDVSHRNRFVAGEGHADYSDWLALVEIGAARKIGAGRTLGGSDLFVLTHAGALAVLDRRETLDLEDFPPALTGDPA